MKKLVVLVLGLILFAGFASAFNIIDWWYDNFSGESDIYFSPTDGLAASYNLTRENFDGNYYFKIPNSEDINLGIHGARTVSAWFRVSDSSSMNKQVIYEEGGGVRGLSIYIYNGKVYGGGWNTPQEQSGWEGTFLSYGIESRTLYQIVLILEGSAAKTPGALKLYVNGQLIETGQGSQLWSHSDGIGVGGRESVTRFHDGVSSGNVQNNLIGEIKNLKIYNYVFNGDEVLGKYTEELAGMTSGNEVESGESSGSGTEGGTPAAGEGSESGNGIDAGGAGTAAGTGVAGVPTEEGITINALSKCLCDHLQSDGRYSDTRSCTSSDWADYGGLRVLRENPDSREITYSCLRDYASIGEGSPLVRSARDSQIYYPNIYNVGEVCYAHAEQSFTERPGLLSPAPIRIITAVLSAKGIYASDGRCVTTGPLVYDNGVIYGGYGSERIGWQCWQDVQDKIEGKSIQGYAQSHNGQFFCNTCDPEYVSYSPSPSQPFQLTGCELSNGEEGYCALVNSDAANLANLIETTIATEEFKIPVDESGRAIVNGRFKSYPACISKEGNNVIAMLQTSRGRSLYVGPTYTVHGFREGIEVQDGEFLGFFIDAREGACGYDVVGYDESECLTGQLNVEMPVKDAARSYEGRQFGNYAVPSNVFQGDGTEGMGLNCIDFGREIGSGAPYFAYMVNGALAYRSYEDNSGVVCSSFFSDVPINSEVFDVISEVGDAT